MIPHGIFDLMKKNNLAIITTQAAYMELGFIKDNLFNTQVRRTTCSKGEADCVCLADTCKKTTETGILTGHSHFFDDPLLKQLTPPELIQPYFDFGFYGGNKWTRWEIEHSTQGYRHRTLRKMMEEGVTVLAGTDSMWESTFFGFSLHRELELMWLAGQEAKVPEKHLTEMKVLQTATSNTHEFLGHYRGRIQPNFKADLIAVSYTHLTLPTTPYV